MDDSADCFSFEGSSCPSQHRGIACFDRHGLCKVTKGGDVCPFPLSGKWSAPPTKCFWHKTLKGRSIVFVGDSMMRQLFVAAVYALRGSSVVLGYMIQITGGVQFTGHW